MKTATCAIEVGVQPKKVMRIDQNIQKLDLPEFYHLVLAPNRRIELWELPITYSINDQEYEMFDIAEESLWKLDPALILASHGMYQVEYINMLKERNPKRVNSGTRMLIGKFRRKEN